MLVMGFQVYGFRGVVMMPREDSIMELMWTVVPRLLVLVLCFFKLHRLLYDKSFRTSYPIKVVGHQ